MSLELKSENKPDDPLLAIKNLEKSYGEGKRKVKVLGDINLKVERGEWVSIMGPSGSGKTTLLNLIGLLDKHDNGQIIFDGEDILTFSPAEKAAFRSNRIGIVFQNHYLIPTMTLKENVELPFVWSGEKIKLKELNERVLAAIELVGLGDRLNHFPRELSGGEKQRVAIARALVNRCPLILLDEPTGNLDGQTGKAILSIFRTIADQGDTSLIMVTHDPDTAQLTDRILLLKQGSIIELKTD
ncbi:MAG: ABC transporter ATP-binding protein [Candidatus Hodarchaeales archaeon]|jgi:putative ABC transport system ATP-binding protein